MLINVITKTNIKKRKEILSYKLPEASYKSQHRYA
ncbi:CLUMA_CG003838, isoform A [Clunio marinus]|uniref:CLUMA_CG003838, isoform A n=1 Tax=Clunio marinus TaxID=568069 RepID=A0A1J1HPY5_9DIPT|nr:CLUMA_CG003838, isoform A [Clunio marinus]